MAKEANAPKGGPKPSATSDTPTRIDDVAPVAAPPKKAVKTKLVPKDVPTEKKTAPAVKAQGKIIRKDTPVPPSTRGSMEETVGPLVQMDTKKSSEGPVQKPSDSLDAQVAAPPSPSKGATVLGEYKLLKKLGQGGMGAVYKAQHLEENRIVAVKVLAKELASKPAYVQRFQREARAMQKVDHPHVLTCLTVGEARGYHYIAMEFVEGGSVENWLKKLGRFSIGDALHLVLKTAEGLQHAHDKGLIHRDIKPDNILLTKDGVVKIADLGLAKDTDDDQSLTKTGAGAGTPIYMAPEQARDVKHVDSRVDIYALGVMMYVFLTGKAPFEGATLVELTTAKEKGKFDPMRKHNEEVPAKLDLIVDKMLAKDPKHRYASCDEIIAQIEPLGLASDELSFFESKPQAAVTTIRQRKPSADTDAPPAPAKGGAKTKTPAQLGAKTAAPKTPEMTKIQEEDDTQKDVWYWNLVTPEGKKVTKKVTTEQLRLLIKAGHLDADAEISKSMKGEYRPAASYKEFQPSFRARETQTQANVKGRKYKTQMQELAEEHERRKKYSWLKRLFGSIGGTLFGLLWIVLILGVVAVGGYLLWSYLQ